MPSDRSILIVDSDRLLRETLATIIRQGGYGVMTAADASHALRRMRTVSFDAAILDLNTGDEDDIRIVARLRAVFPCLPILVLAGVPQFDVVQFVQEFQIRNVLQKPVDPDLILGCVADIFKPA